MRRLVGLLLVVSLAGCADESPPTVRGCPEGWSYLIADGIVKVSWRDYCLSPDGSQTVDPEWMQP